MKTFATTRVVAPLLLWVAIAASNAHAQAKGSEVAAVQLLIERFHAALASGDARTAEKLLATDAVILEAGMKESRAEYLEHHLHEDIKFAKALPSTRSQPQITFAGDVAWVSSTSVTQEIYQSKSLNMAGAELMVLTRTPSGWIIRAIHWSSRKTK